MANQNDSTRARYSEFGKRYSEVPHWFDVDLDFFNVSWDWFFIRELGKAWLIALLLPLIATLKVLEALTDWQHERERRSRAENARRGQEFLDSLEIPPDK